MSDVLTQVAQAQKPEAIVWRGDWSLSRAQQGLKVLGVPVGHPSFIAAQMTSKLKEQAVLFERISLIDDVQVGWLLLVFCAATRANYWLRTVLPEHTEEYAMGHDRNVLPVSQQYFAGGGVLPSHSHDVASLPLTLGGLGVGSLKIRHAAHWGSWADCLEMIKQRHHPGSAEDIIHGMAVGLGHMKVVGESGTRLREMGVRIPPWEALAEGLRPQTSDAEHEPCQVSHGWQKYAAQAVHEHHRDHVLWPRLSPDQCALVRSQSGPLASVPLTALPVHRVSKMDSEPYRVLLLRRLRLLLPFTVCTCRCGRPLDAFGHHRAACSTVGVFAENAIAQICRERGARVSTNVMLRDLDITPSHRSDARRLEVIAEGLTLFGGSQLAIDATAVSPLHADGTHRRKADTTDGQALAEARKHKDGRAQETKDLWCLASAKAACVPRRLYGSARAAWFRRWSCLLACSTAKSVASSLLGVRGSLGAGDQVRSVNEVLAEARHGFWCSCAGVLDRVEDFVCTCF